MKNNTRNNNVLKNTKREKVDLFKRPLTQEAFLAYINPGLLFPTDVGLIHEPLNLYIPFHSLCYIAKAIRRQIDMKDLELLFHDDGVHKCSQTGEEFRAISWSFITKKQTEEIDFCVNKGMCPREALKKLVRVGPFYVVGNNIFAYSGTPIQVDDYQSPILLSFFKNHNRWGKSLNGAKRLIINNKRAGSVKGSSKISNVGDSWPKKATDKIHN